MVYVHNRHGHSDLANHIADEVCDLLNRFSDEAHRVRLEQIEDGTAPATPWQYDLIRLAWGALCANSMDPVYVEPIGGWTPLKPCPLCKMVHPGDA
jgi:hypothetical protein